MDEELGKKGWGGVKVRRRKIFSLTYANDVAVIAKDEEGMKGMIRVLEKYVKWKDLEVNVEKTKVLRYRKRGEK